MRGALRTGWPSRRMVNSPLAPALSDSMRADFGPPASSATRLTCTRSSVLAGAAAMSEPRTAAARAARIGRFPADLPRGRLRPSVDGAKAVRDRPARHSGKSLPQAHFALQGRKLRREPRHHAGAGAAPAQAGRARQARNGGAHVQQQLLRETEFRFDNAHLIVLAELGAPCGFLHGIVIIPQRVDQSEPARIAPGPDAALRDFVDR